MQRFHAQGWAHFRATMAEPFSGRRSSTQFFEPLCIDDPGAGGGGGGGGGGTGDAGNGNGDGGAGAGGDAEEAAKKAAEDKKLASEAAAWRTKFRGAESRIKELEEAHNTRVGALEAQLEEIKSRGNGNGNGNPQPGAGNASIETHPEFVKLQRQLGELSKNLTTERETLAKERAQLKSEKIQRAIGEVAGEGKFLLPSIFRKVLAEKVDIAADGVLILKVPNEVGGTDDVPFTLDNVLKYRPVDEFDSFLPSNGSNGSGSNGGGASKGRVNDGIDWSKVEGPGMDLDYINKNMSKIIAARNARQQ